MASVIQHILISLPYGMRNYLVTNRSSIHKKVLQIGLTAGKGRQSYPPPQPNPGAIIVNEQRLFHELRSA